MSLELARAYAAAVDARDWDAATALFTEDGVLVTPDPPDELGPVDEHRGHEAIRSAFADLEATDSTRHDVRGVDADGHVTCVAHHVVGSRCIDWHLHYVDTYDGERFSRRELHLERIEVHPA